MSIRGAKVEPQIYDLLIRSGPLSPRIIAEVLGVSDEIVEKALANLINQGVVAKIDEERFIALPRITDLLAKAEEVKNNILGIRDEIQSKFRLLESRIGVSLDNISGAIKEKLDAIINSLEKTLNDIINGYKKLAMSHVEMLQDFSNLLNKLAGELQANIGDVRRGIDSVKSDLASVQKELEDITRTDVDALMEKADKAIKEIKENSMRVINAKIGEFETQLTDMSTAILRSLTDVSAGIKQVLESVGGMLDKVSKTVTSAFKEIDEKLKSDFEAAPDILLKSIEELLNNELMEIEDMITSNKDIVISQVNALISGSINFMRELRASLADIVQNLERAFGEASELFVSRTKTRINEIHETFIGKLDESRDAIIAGAKRLSELTSSSIETVKTVVSGAFLQLRESIRTSITENLLNRVKTLREATNNLSNVRQALDASIRDVNLHYTKALESLLEKMQSDLDDFSRIMDEKMAKILGAIEKISVDLSNGLNLKILAEEVSKQTMNVISEYLDKISVAMRDLNKELLLEIKLGITQELDELISKIDQVELEQDLKKQLKSSLTSVKEKLEKAIESRIKTIPKLLNARTRSFNKALSQVILNTVQLQIRNAIEKVNIRLQESRTNINNELIWLKSEIQGRLRVIIEKRQATSRDLFEEIANENTKLFESIQKEMEQNIKNIQDNITNLRKEIISFRDKQISEIEALAEAIKGDIDSSFESFKSALTKNADRINNTLKVLKESSLLSKEEILKTVTAEFGTLTEKIRSEIDNELSSILSAVEGYGKKIDAMIRKSLTTIDETFNKLKEEISNNITILKDNLNSAIQTFIEKAYPAVINTIKTKQNEILKMISQSRESLQTILYDKISAVDSLGGEIEKNLSKLKDETIATFKSVEEPIEKIRDEAINQLSATIEAFKEKINTEIAGKFGNIETKYNELSTKINSSLEATQDILLQEVMPKHTANVETMGSAFQDFERSLKTSIDDLRKPLKNVLEEFERVIEQEKKSVKSTINDSLGSINKAFEKFLEISEKFPEEIDKTLNKYIESLKARPKGLFIVYGVDVLNTIIRDMARRTEDVVVVITPVLDNAIKEIVEEVSQKALVEVFTSSVLAKPEGHIFIFTMAGIPQNLLVVSRDNLELIMIVDASDGRKIGVIFEGEPVKTILKTIVK